MGERERILWADDHMFLIDRSGLFEFVEEEGHEVVAKPKSVEEVESVLDSGIKPTLAIVDGNMPSKGDGERAAAIIREKSPETKVVSYSSVAQSWGDQNWHKDMDLHELIEKIRNI